LTWVGLPKSFWKIVAKIDGLAGGVSEAIWAAVRQDHFLCISLAA
jgi:hypothetical protein